MDVIAPRNQLDTLWQRGRDFLGTDVAIMGGAMTWVSERNLVSALSNAGGFGVIACGAMTPELLDGELQSAGGRGRGAAGTRAGASPRALETRNCRRRRVGAPSALGRSSS